MQFVVSGAVLYGIEDLSVSIDAGPLKLGRNLATLFIREAVSVGANVPL